MNSQSLQDKSPDVYKDFFSHHSIVVSAPGSFIWFGDYSVMEGGFAIMQKLPMRVYVGFEVSTSGEVDINDFLYFNTSKQKFESSSMALSMKNSLCKYIRDYLYANGYETGVRINILSEVPPGRGMNMSGALSCAIAIALHVYLGELTPKEIYAWKNVDLGTLIQKINYRFDPVFRLAWKMTAIMHGGISSGSSSFAPFINTPYPFIYFSERRGEFKDNNKYRDIRFPKNFNGDWHIFDQIFYGGIKFEELFFLRNMPNWPVDFGLLYSGDVRMTATTHTSLEDIKEILEDSANLINSKLAPFIDDKPIVPYFYYLTKRYKGRSLWQIYIQPTLVIAIEGLRVFKNLFKKGLAESSIKEFFACINRAADIYRLHNLSCKTFDYISDYLKKEMQKLGDSYGAAVKPIGSGKKGNVLFALAYHGLRDQIHRVIKEMREETKEDIVLDYASWIDGIEENGIKVEQYLDQEIYSEFISPGSVLIEHLNYKGNYHSDIYTYDEYLKILPEVDLLIDEIDNKIYIKGKQLTSKDLHSSSATVEILKFLLAKAGDPVSNKLLPKSGYAKDRNELQSKIITPLNKVIRKKTKKNINLKISGGLCNFTVILGRKGLDIYQLKKIF